MAQFIELTTPEGNDFLANISQIKTIIDVQGRNKDENTFIVGLSNNGGTYVQELYPDIFKAIKDKFQLSNPIIKL